MKKEGRYKTVPVAPAGNYMFTAKLFRLMYAPTTFSLYPRSVSKFIVLCMNLARMLKFLRPEDNIASAWT